MTPLELSGNGASVAHSSRVRPSTTVVKPGREGALINWRELVEYRDLFYFLVWRDIKSRYKQTALGFTWAVIKPLFSMIVFSVVFGGLAGMPSDGVPYPVFNFCALVPWTYFSMSMAQSIESLIGSKDLIKKVYFPRLIIPLNPVLSNLVDFTISLAFLGVLMVWYGIAPTWNVAFLPILVMLMMATAAGIGMWLSALAIQYRDVRHVSKFLGQILMYAAPVVWGASLIEENFGSGALLLYGTYPMAGVIEGFRAALLGTRAMPWELIGIGSLTAMTLFVSGALYYRRKERIFADVA